MKIQSGSSDDILDITPGKTARVSLFSASGIELLDSEGRLPVTHEPVSRGVYVLALKTGNIAATLASGSLLFALVWAGTRRFHLRDLRLSAIVTAAVTTGVVVGLDAYIASVVTVNATGGTAISLVGGEGRKRTSYPDSLIDGVTASAPGGLTEIRIATTAALGAGTATLYANPHGSRRGFTGTALGTQVFAEPADCTPLVSVGAPIELVDGEGLYIKSIGVGPATGTFEVQVTMEWAELEA